MHYWKEYFIFRKGIALIVSITILLACLLPVFAAELKNKSHSDADEILFDYHTKVNKLRAEERNDSMSATSTHSMAKIKQAEQETIKELADAGYEAYAINSDSYFEVQE